MTHSLFMGKSLKKFFDFLLQIAEGSVMIV